MATLLTITRDHALAQAIEMLAGEASHRSACIENAHNALILLGRMRPDIILLDSLSPFDEASQLLRCLALADELFDLPVALIGHDPGLSQIAPSSHVSMRRPIRPAEFHLAIARATRSNRSAGFRPVASRANHG